MRHVILSRTRDNTWVVAIAQEALDSNTNAVVGSALFVKVARGPEATEHTQVYRTINEAFVRLDNGVMSLITGAGFQMELYNESQGKEKEYE
jgi:hypothetical protein